MRCAKNGFSDSLETVPSYVLDVINKAVEEYEPPKRCGLPRGSYIGPNKQSFQAILLVRFTCLKYTTIAKICGTSYEIVRKFAVDIQKGKL
jgi:hypothetical protein